MDKLKPDLQIFKTEYLKNGGNGTQAAKKARPHLKNDKVAEKTGRRMYAKVRVSIQETLDKYNVTGERIAKKISDKFDATKPISCNVFIDKNGEMKNADGKSLDFIEVDDNNIQLKAVELACKIKGYLHSDVNIDQSQHKKTVIIYETTDTNNRNRLGNTAQNKVTQESD